MILKSTYNLLWILCGVQGKREVVPDMPVVQPPVIQPVPPPLQLQDPQMIDFEIAETMNQLIAGAPWFSSTNNISHNGD